MIKFKMFFIAISALLFLTSEHKVSQNIEGNWSFCAEGNDEQQIISNICREVFFDKNVTGFFKNASGDKSNFQWNITDSTIEFNLKPEKDNNTWFSNNYTFTFKIYNEGKFEHFELREKNANWRYRLSRSKRI